MLATQALIDELASRIQRVYRLRHPGWRWATSSQRVWDAAAANLYAIHEKRDEFPLDPELYVAA